MNLFSRNQPDRVTEQDLLALHLNELSPARAQVVRRTVARDPALAAESASIAATLAAVTLSAPGGNRNSISLNQTILERNWEAIRPRLGSPAPISLRWQVPVLAGGVLAAGAAGVALLIPAHHPVAPDSMLSPGVAQVAGQNPRVSQHPILTARPIGPDGGDAGFRPHFSSGVYQPKSSRLDAAVHAIGLASNAHLTANSPATEPLQQFPSIPITDVHPPLEAQAPFLSSGSARAISSAQPSVRFSGKSHRSHPLDVMLGIGGTFLGEHDALTAGNEPRTLKVTHAILAIGSVHQQFRTGLGYRVTLSYTRPQFGYTYGSPVNIPVGTGFDQGGYINSRIFEAAGTYVIQGPHHKRISTSADAGGALMAFLPTHGGDPTVSYGFRGAGVVGVNVDYAIGRGIGAHAGYRAQVFKSPGFHYSGSTIPVTTPVVVDNEPSVGVTYTFGKK